MAKKTPTADFELYFSGTGIYPEAIPFNALARSLSAVQRIAIGESQPQEDGGDGSENAIKLLGVRRGSARFQCSAPHRGEAVARIRLVGSIVDDPEKADQAEYVFTPIEDLSAVAKSLGCSIVIRDPVTRDVFATIGPDSFSRIATSMFVQGDTTISGRVERVGGATQTRCALRVDFQPHLLYCTVGTEEVARKMGQHLYEDVVAEGNASFLRTSWRIARFNVTNIYQPKTGSFCRRLGNLGTWAAALGTKSKTHKNIFER